MADYIFCLKKKNNPRIDVRICQKKCPYKDHCPEFLEYDERTNTQSHVLDPRPIMPPLVSLMASKSPTRP